jgi:hypothetical protein
MLDEVDAPAATLEPPAGVLGAKSAKSLLFLPK